MINGRRRQQLTGQTIGDRNHVTILLITPVHTGWLRHDQRHQAPARTDRWNLSPSNLHWSRRRLSGSRCLAGNEKRQLRLRPVKVRRIFGQ